MSNDSLVSLWSRYSLILLPLKVGRAVHLALEGKSIVWKDPGAIKMLAVCIAHAKHCTCLGTQNLKALGI